MCFCFLALCQQFRYVVEKNSKENTMLLALQVIKGCWQLSGGHKCVPVLHLFSLLLYF